MVQDLLTVLASVELAAFGFAQTPQVKHTRL